MKNAANRPAGPVSRAVATRLGVSLTARRLALSSGSPPLAGLHMTVTTKVTELSGSRVRLDAEVPGEEVESRVQRAARQIGQELRIPGFRKGKVPGPMVIQRIGRDAVLEQAVRDSLPEWYEEALMRSGVTSIGEPKLDMEEMPDADAPLRFSIEVGVTPKAKIGDYKGLEAGRREPEVPAEAIDQEIERLREPLARV